MKTFCNHVDHLAWISRRANLATNLARLELLSGATLTRERPDRGMIICVNWAAGIVLAPFDERRPANGQMHDWLDERGDGDRANRLEPPCPSEQWH